jgi:hypothetical protein
MGSGLVFATKKLTLTPFWKFDVAISKAARRGWP